MRGRWESVQTAHGTYRMPHNQAQDFRWLRTQLSRIDAGGQRPLFAFGYSGGFNYALGRPNATPISQGFMLSNVAPLDIVAKLTDGSAPPILIDTRAYNHIGRPSNHLDFSHWEPPVATLHYWRFDRRYFDMARAGCSLTVKGPGARNPFFTIYDCRRGAARQAGAQ
jgi:hypothetical protein